jgi:hypothetical protein
MEKIRIDMSKMLFTGLAMFGILFWLRFLLCGK